jgi:outer membrane protein
MLRFIGALLIVGLLLTPGLAGAAELKIGVVDDQAILAQSAEGKRVQENIKRKAEELGKPFQQKRQDLARQMEEFQKQAGVMKDDARKRKAEELEKKMREFERQGADAEKQLQQFQEKELAPLLKKMEQAIETVAKEEKLDLVLHRQGVMVLNKSLDITEKVRNKFGR